MAGALHFGELGPEAIHLAIDMQRLFAEPTAWHTPALNDVLGKVRRIAAHGPHRTIFTRFLTPARVEDAPGTWQTYYQRWQSVLADRNDPGLFDLAGCLDSFVPPAEIIDKFTYSAFGASTFPALLARRGTRALILSGVETDVCVLATALDAVDRGFRVVLVTDALASSNRQSHEATLAHVIPRFDRQIETVDTGTLLQCWTP